MVKKVFFVSLVFALIFVSACAGSEHTPDNENATQGDVIQTSQDIPEEEMSDLAQDDIRDLVYAELVVENLRLGDEEISRSFGTDDPDSLLWIENTFGARIKLGSRNNSDRPECPFWAKLLLTRSDGAVFEIYPATDDCTTFIYNDYYYTYGSGLNSAFYELFGASHFDALLSVG